MGRSRLTAVIIALLILLFFIPGAAAQEVRSGGNVVIPEGETVQGLTVTGGTITVRGTVEGDLTAFGGDINIPGNVTGQTTAFGGSIRIPGNIAGNMTAVAGFVELTDTGSIGETFSVAAGDVVLNGSVGNDARIDAERLQVGPSASIGGNLEHATQSLSLANNASVGGDIQQVDSINVAGDLPVQTNIPFWAVSLYGFVVNLILGLILLFLWPERSWNVAAAAARRPIMSIVIGILTFILVPIILALLAITIIGIPIAFIGLFAYLIMLWVASVYGAFAIGAAIMDAVDVMNRWIALFVGLVVVFLLGAIPFVGGLVHFIVLLLGLGALVSAAR